MVLNLFVYKEHSLPVLPVWETNQSINQSINRGCMHYINSA